MDTAPRCGRDHRLHICVCEGLGTGRFARGGGYDHDPGPHHDVAGADLNHAAAGDRRVCGVCGDIQATAAGLSEEAVTANQEWEDGGSYTAALNALRDIAARTGDLSLDVENTTVPESAAASWAVVQAAADAMVIAGNGMVEGIQAPDNGQIRRTALEEYLKAAEELDAGVIVSIAAAKE